MALQTLDGRVIQVWQLSKHSSSEGCLELSFLLLRGSSPMLICETAGATYVNLGRRNQEVVVYCVFLTHLANIRHCSPWDPGTLGQQDHPVIYFFRPLFHRIYYGAFIFF